MKKIYLLLPLALCACDRNENPECLKNLNEVQVIDVIGDANDGPAALAVNCNKKMGGGCIGDTVLLPKGFATNIQKDQKFKVPELYCFVKVGEFEYIRNDKKKDRVPVVEYRYNKKTLSETDWDYIIKNGYKKTYTECVYYAGKEFKNIKPEDNEKACKCFADYMWNGYRGLHVIKDDIERANATKMFYETFLVEIKKQCGSKIPTKTLHEMSKK